MASAESLTSGYLSAALGRGQDAASWFAGGVVAYASEVKFTVLGVREGPVITADCARQMALGVTALMRSDVSVAVTGVGGPDEEEGHPPGTVYVATNVGGHTHVTRHHFSGEPGDVVDATVEAALGQLASGLESWVEDP